MPLKSAANVDPVKYEFNRLMNPSGIELNTMSACTVLDAEGSYILMGDMMRSVAVGHYRNTELAPDGSSGSADKFGMRIWRDTKELWVSAAKLINLGGQSLVGDDNGNLVLFNSPPVGFENKDSLTVDGSICVGSTINKIVRMSRKELPYSELSISSQLLALFGTVSGGIYEFGQLTYAVPSFHVPINHGGVTLNKYINFINALSEIYLMQANEEISDVNGIKYPGRYMPTIAERQSNNAKILDMQYVMKLLDQDLSAPNQRLFEQILMQNAAVNYEGGRYMSYGEAREITELIIGTRW
jgi:hypothetical protein